MGNDSFRAGIGALGGPWAFVRARRSAASGVSSALPEGKAVDPPGVGGAGRPAEMRGLGGAAREACGRGPLGP